MAGPYLDAKVSAERTAFMFLQEADLDFPGEMTREELDAEVVKALKQVAEPYTTQLREEKRQLIQTFIQQDAPQYRFQLQERYRDKLERIPANVSKDQLDIELYKTQKDIELEHRQRAADIRKGPLDTVAGSPEYAALYQQFLDDENELGKERLPGEVRCPSAHHPGNAGNRAQGTRVGDPMHARTSCTASSIRCRPTPKMSSFLSRTCGLLTSALPTIRTWRPTFR